jgi:hypothetical protein
VVEVRPQMAAIRKNHRNGVDFGSLRTSFWVKEDAARDRADITCQRAVALSLYRNQRRQ